MRNLLSNTLSLSSHGLLWLLDLRLRKYNSHLAMRNAILQSVSKTGKTLFPLPRRETETGRGGIAARSAPIPPLPSRFFTP